MVKKLSNYTVSGGPPPLDESWWEAVLSEVDGGAPPSNKISPAPAQSGPKPRSERRSAPERRPAQERRSQAGRLAATSLDIDWEGATQIYEQDLTVRLHVDGHNRGGLLVSGESLQGFLPVSHLIDANACQTEAEQEEQLASYTGQTLELKIIECDEERGRVVFSERAALAGPGSRNELLHHLRPGQCVEGTVTNITDFGVFVDLGGIEGLIHVSELSWGRVHHPSDVVKYGDNLKVHVIQIHADRSRVALSIKRLYANPWESAEERYLPGQITDAVVTSIVPYGAFARLEEGLDGLIHISELPAGETDDLRPEEILYEGQHIRVRVLHVDAARQRLGLSMRVEE